MIYFCCEEGRRSLVRQHPSLNGIDYLEVIHHAEVNVAEQQRKLRVFFVKEPNAALQGRLTSDKFANATLIRVTGGERVQRIAVDWVEWVGTHLDVHVTPRGDYGSYTLSLVEPNSDQPLKELDRSLAAVDFSFKVECESEFDCRPTCECPPTETSAPDLDYLAKDYASFRQLMLDRLAVLAPEWRERNPADLGVTLVELLAYVGDYLSYRQDAIATEAYLGTARRRVSLQRHTRLLDYVMHDGCNARVWIQVRVKPEASNGVVLGIDGVSPPRFVTRLGTATVLADHEFERLAGGGSPVVFEAMERAELFPEHNEMFFHTWGDAACCLPKGGTKATLRGHFPNLQPGQVVIFVERVGPKTGNVADADPLRRHAVRLTKINGLDRKKYVQAKQEDALPQLTDPLFDPAIRVTEIEWAEADSLPFPFCLSSRTEEGGQLLDDVTMALGNIILADHGMTMPRPEKLPPVPAPEPALAPAGAAGCDRCGESERLMLPPRFRPQLNERQLTQAAPYDATRSASDAFVWEMKDVLPAIHLRDKQGRVWRPKHDLLSSAPFAAEFVVEVETDGRADLRFGDDENGLAPGEGTQLEAVYRIGNGSRGNLGIDALVHVVTNESIANLLASVSNPLPARRGTDLEPLEEARQSAPAAFRVQQRAVTPADYAEKAGLHPDVQRAAATLRWTGSWHTIFLTIDRRGGRMVDRAFESELRAHLERYRLAGHDLEIDGPRYVPLELELRVCASANYFQSDVIAALKIAFDNQLHADGSLGFFHPDNFTFGQPVLLSRIYAAAMRIAGVRHVQVTILRRQGATVGELVPASDVFSIGRLEIARLDNHPNFPDRGILRFTAVGGRR